MGQHKNPIWIQNQMNGSSSTSLSEMLGKKIEISPPEAVYEIISDLDLSTLGLKPGEHLVNHLSYKKR